MVYMMYELKDFTINFVKFIYVSHYIVMYIYNSIIQTQAFKLEKILPDNRAGKLYVLSDPYVLPDALFLYNIA